MSSQTSVTPNPENGRISLKEFIRELKEWQRFIRSKWLPLLLLAIIGGIAGFAYALIKKPQYKAVTKFVLEEEEQPGMLANLGGLAAMAGIDIGSEGGLFHGENIIELYTSRSMITAALLSPVTASDKKVLLVDLYTDYKGLRQKWQSDHVLKDFRFSEQVSSRLQDSIIGCIVKDINKEHLKVFKSGQSSTLNVEVKAGNELFAKAFNEAIVQQVNEFYISAKTKKTKEALDILQAKSDSVLRIMNGAISSAAITADATPNLNPTRQAQRVVPVQKAQFTAEANKAILSELIKNLELTKMKLMKETPLIEIIDKPIFPLEKDKPGRIKSILAGGLSGMFLMLSLLVLKRIFAKIEAE